MTYKLSKLNTKDDIELPEEEVKPLPSVYRDDHKNFLTYFIVSLILHPIAMCGIWLLFMLLTYLNIIVPLANKPEWKTPDIEFVLTENEAEPINKKTPYRSDKNSRAGGKHDPSRKVSMPSPAPAPAPAQKTPAPQKPQPKQEPVKKQIVQNPIKNIVKPQPQPPAEKPAPPQKVVSKPSKINAPVQKPVLKPSPATPKPQMPKLTTTPTSPFQVQVPKTGAPVGVGFSASQGTASTGGSSGKPAGSYGKTGSGMPAPQFSTSRVASARAGAGTGSPSSKGTGGYGTGHMGNPGPGNPSGAPGIDAIKSPQWGPYMRELESKIKKNWYPPKGDKSKRVVLLFKIGRRGDLISVRVAKSSGSQENDQAAIRAVQMSAPFRALPPEFTGSNVEIDFTFDYNVLGASYR